MKNKFLAITPRQGFVDDVSSRVLDRAYNIVDDELK